MTVRAFSEGSQLRAAVVGALTVLFSFACAMAIARYLRWSPEPMVRTIVFLLLFLSLRKIPVHSWRDAFDRRELVAFGLFSGVLSLSLMLGYHIIITSGYSGLMADDYISPYSWVDPVAFVSIFAGLSVLSLSLYSLIKKKSVCDEVRDGESAYVNLEPLMWKWVFGLGVLIFILWVPYLLAYWPGFVFGDSLSSIRQAIGMEGWQNNHPFIYTLFLKACIRFVGLFGFSITTGCALYSILQMIVMAAGFAYLARWVVVRARVASAWGFVIAIGMAASPYIATYSIALWKDPIFSLAILMVSLLLFDFVLTRGRVVRESRAWTPLFLCALFGTTLLRGNGIYIACIIALVLGAIYLVLRRRKQDVTRKPLALCVVVIVVSLCVTGPGYAMLGVRFLPVESVGIFLNQMARVAAVDGEMTESDRAYMNEMLPIEEYATKYHPGCVDMLKWDASFNASPIKDGFFSHWLSMGLRNPGVYFEAWELQTCGFWAINQSAANVRDSNIGGGMPVNFHPETDNVGIAAQNKLGSDEARSIFPFDEWAIPASWLNWAVVYLALCVGLLRRKRWLLSFVPTFALVFTLLIASPIWYWSRYEAAVYFLIPFYVGVIVMLLRSGCDRAALKHEERSRQSHP